MSLNNIIEFLDKNTTKEELMEALIKKDGVTSGIRHDGVCIMLINPTKEGEK